MTGEKLEEKIKESEFTLEIIRNLDNWSNRIKSKSEEDFNSQNAYAEWLEECKINLRDDLNNIVYFYQRIRNINEDAIDEMVKNLKEAKLI